ncbi:MAG: MATE family efflux transporter, partial [Bacillota bacterium]|nr:MATE family efflux transporter [Bacillota bacterium]
KGGPAGGDGGRGGDIYFVSKLNMGAKGAALATVLSQSISVIICFFIIRKRGLSFDFGKASFKRVKGYIVDTLKLGAPIALQSIMVSLSFSVIVSIVNNLGVETSAGMGVAEKVCVIIMLVPSSFSQALSAFVAQNVGAGKPKRADQGLWYAIATSFVIAIFIAYFSFFHGNILTGIFSKDEAVILAGWEYLKAYAIDVLLTSWMFCFVGYFNGLGCTAFVMIQGIVSAFGVRVPVSYLMSKQVPVSLFKIGLATPASTLLQVILCVIYYVHLHKKSRRF